MPDLLIWAIAWIVVTVMFWLAAQVLGSPKTWYTSAILAGIAIVAGELADLLRQKRNTRERKS